MTWVWITVLAAVALSSAVVSLEARQRRFLAHFNEEQTLLQQVQVDLAKGYLHVALAGRANGPYDRAQGMALLDQAGEASRTQFPQLALSVAQFRDLLISRPSDTEPDPRRDADVRIAFAALERQAASLESLVRQDLSVRMRSHARSRSMILWGSGLLLAAVCAALLVAGRARKRAETARRGAETRFRLLFDRSPDGILLIDPATGRILEFNETTHRQLGYTREEFSRLGIADFETVESPEEIRARVARVAREGRSEFETRHRARDGEIKEVLVTAQLGELDGLPVLHCVFRDITLRKQAEAERRDAEARFQAFFEQSPVGMSLTALDGTLDRVNPALCRLLGYSKEELARISFALVTHPDDVAASREWVRSLLAGEREAASGERRYLTKDGRTVWAQVDTTLGRDDHGHPVHFFTHIRDITEQRRAGEAIRESLERTERSRLAMLGAMEDQRRAEGDRDRLATAIDQAAETVLITDAAGGIVYVNPAFEAVTGYTRAEVLGQNASILQSGAQDEAVYRELWESIRSGKTWHGRLLTRKKSGKIFTEDATLSPVHNEAGVITSYVAVKRDITHELAMEAQFLQSQKMEGIGRLAGGVAHDFNNILSVILSCAGFALEGVREGDPLREDILEIEKAGKRAAALTRQLLAFSRKQVMEPVSLDLNRALAEMEKMLRRIIGEDVDLVQVLAPDLGLVRADPGQVEQVIMNLAVNARDAMPDGGKLTVETSNVELDEEYTKSHVGAVPGPHVMVAISDSGVGMDEQTLTRLFEPFFTTKGLGKGTGLGLSTVYGIVKQSGGSIFVYSEPGQGTTFKLFFPRESLDALPAAQAPSAPTRAGGSETVLLVEDDQAVRNLARRVLDGAGYTVLPAANGGEALLICEQHPGKIHLVLSDVVMPLMGGQALVERLAKVRPGIKALFMSGYTDNAIVHHGDLDPGTHFIGKPFTQAGIVQKVRDVLDAGL
jgi:two-component system cell cycle sensor histidine kinase/response regulator CckA